MKHNISYLLKLLKADTANMLFEPEKIFENVEIEKNDNYIFINNHSDVLAVAHMDTVKDISWGGYYNGAWSREFSDPVVNKTGIDDFEVTSVNLDDRLGIYIIMCLLPQLGIKTDVLLTIDEEISQSTAMLFKTSKQYNWMFQFDRHGFGNVVMYQYHTKELEKMLEGIGYEVERGTFSDISVLDHLGCSGFNFGVGYRNEHTNFCSTRKSWIDVCVSLFYDFYQKNKSIVYPYTYIPVQPKVYWGGYSGTSSGGRIKDKPHSPTYERGTHGFGRCKVCGTSLFEGEIGICDECTEDVKDIKAHTAIVKQEKSFKEYQGRCMDCGKEFQYDEEYEVGKCYECMDDEDYEVLFGIQQQIENKYYCDVCGVEYSVDDLENRVCLDCRLALGWSDINQNNGG